MPRQGRDCLLNVGIIEGMNTHPVEYRITGDGRHQAIIWESAEKQAVLHILEHPLKKRVEQEVKSLLSKK